MPWWGAKKEHVVVRRKKEHETLKIAVFGDLATGKDSLIKAFVNGACHESPPSGGSFVAHKVTVNSKAVTLHILSLSGQERFIQYAPPLYHGAQAAIVVYDVTDVDSFLNCAHFWVKHLRRQANPDMVITLAGNKADMCAEHREVSTEEAQAFADEHQLLFMETSAMTHMNVDELFNAMVLRRMPKEQE